MGRGQQPEPAAQPRRPAPRYERVKVDGVKGHILLEIASENALVLAGYEVNKSGDRIAPTGADERLRIIDQKLIVDRRPMRMNLHYAELELDDGPAV